MIINNLEEDPSNSPISELNLLKLRNSNVDDTVCFNHPQIIYYNLL